MTQYAILTSRPNDPAAIETLEAARCVLGGRGWTKRVSQPGLEVWTPSAQVPAIFVSPTADGVVVGKIFGDPGSSWSPDPVTCARALCGNLWGRYVAIFRAPAGEAVAMLRDPSGAVEALSWSPGGVTIVASDVDFLLEAIPPAGLEIDWDLLGRVLIDPLAMAGGCPLKGVVGSAPGALKRFDDSVDVLAWAPATFAGLSLADTPETRRRMVETIDNVVLSLANPNGRAIAELSGGLDSSIVAGALARIGDLAVEEWVHYFVEDAGGDERHYARATARHLGIPLTEVSKATFGLRLEALDIASGAIKPSGSIADAYYDQDMTERSLRLGATQLFTGLGGDTVFMQGGGPLVAADDYWRQSIWRVGLGPALDVARHTKTSVWSVLRRAQAARLRPSPTPYRVQRDHLAPNLRSTPIAARHPWLDNLEGVAPTKRRQVMHLAHQLLVSGRNARGQVVEIVNPLLSQPVMELCLSLSARALTHGGDDRVMAREAFHDRLAPEIVSRRSKGDLGRHYGRAIAEDLEAVRALLLDGELARAGLLDLAALDDMLTPETLIWRGPYREVVIMIVLEQWARSWSRRLARLDKTRGAERLVEPA